MNDKENAQNDGKNIDQNIFNKNETSSQEIKDIKLVKSSNTFEVALEYQKQLIHQEYRMNELEKNAEHWKGVGKKEVEADFNTKLQVFISESNSKLKRNFFIYGFLAAFALWFLLTYIVR